MVHPYEKLPDNLPIPQDDNACDHLPGMALPNKDLPSTQDDVVNLGKLRGWVVVYCYPMTGQPGIELPEGWDDIPGARGCTPQSCAFRDHYSELQDFNAEVFGLSTQPTAYQKEIAQRVHLPFRLLSDQNLKLCQALNLPTFTIDSLMHINSTLIKRTTLIAKDGIIRAVHYPVFPPHADADWVLDYLKSAS
ncbi:MAG: peroxiredoxin [Pseudomonadota bacterium]